MKLLNLPFDEKIILIKPNKYLDILIYYVQYTAIEYCKNHPEKSECNKILNLYNL